MLSDKKHNDKTKEIPVYTSINGAYKQIFCE